MWRRPRDCRKVMPDRGSCRRRRSRLIRRPGKARRAWLLGTRMTPRSSDRDVAAAKGLPEGYAGPWELPTTAIEAYPPTGEGTPGMAPGYPYDPKVFRSGCGGGQGIAGRLCRTVGAADDGDRGLSADRGRHAGHGSWVPV